MAGRRMAGRGAAGARGAQMAYLDVAGRVLLGVVLAIAFAGKARSQPTFAEFAGSLRDLGWLTSRGRAVVAVLIPASEGTIAVMLAVPATATWAFAAALALLAALTIGAGIAL